MAAAAAADRDAVLRGLGALEHDTVLPVAVVKHYLATAGVRVTDERVLRLIALDAHRFADSVVQDALAKQAMRRAGLGKSAKDGGKRVKLAAEGTAQDSSKRALQSSVFRESLAEILAADPKTLGIKVLRAQYYVMNSS